jgi:phage pi2 protein 07
LALHAVLDLAHISDIAPAQHVVVAASFHENLRAQSGYCLADVTTKLLQQTCLAQPGLFVHVALRMLQADGGFIYTPNENPSRATKDTIDTFSYFVTDCEYNAPR